jgi:signal transduction histidine kinase
VCVQLELDDSIKLNIRNSRPTGRRSSSGSGHGLGGMRERAELLGGWLRAEPDGEGWLVECFIPGDA